MIPLLVLSSFLLALPLAAAPRPQVPPPDAPQLPPGLQPPKPGTPMPVPLALACRRGTTAIQIDGSLIEWPELPPIRLDDSRQLSGTANGAWRGDLDCSAKLFLLWDEDNLYVAAQVRDEWHRALDAKAVMLQEVPAADSVVLTFDPDRDTRSIGPDPGRVEDREYWLADEPSHSLVQWDRLRGDGRLVEAGSQFVSHDKEHGITTYEARIPWADILPVGRKPAEGMAFDLQVVVNDYDEVTDPLPQTRIGWTFGCGPLVDPGLLGTVLLAGDAKDLQGKAPKPPDRKVIAREPVPGPDHWRAFAAALDQVPPAVHDGSAAPAEAGGLQRLRLLEELDDQCERFPRVDWIEFHARIQRRMQREVGGITRTGLPWYWYEATKALSKRAEAAPPAGRLRLFRLPMGGWLVRSQVRNFAIDPAGPDLASFLWGGMEFALITQPLDFTRRNDQLLLRMLAAKPPRPFLTHIVFHLPSVLMSDIKVVEPGKSYGQESGLEVQALGKANADGSVPATLGYRVQFPNGASVLIAPPTLTVAELPEQPVSVLILSARNPDAVAVAKAAKADMVLIDDAFLPQAFPNVRRLRLTDAHALQKAILPKPSVLLAPGESWDTGPR